MTNNTIYTYNSPSFHHHCAFGFVVRSSRLCLWTVNIMYFAINETEETGIDDSLKKEKKKQTRTSNPLFDLASIGFVIQHRSHQLEIENEKMIETR